MSSVVEAETVPSSSPVPKIITQNLSPSPSTTTSKSESQTKRYPEFMWMVKPCFIYKEEYKDCKSFKARFHQYFVDGEKSDCQHWKDDYDNCIKWESKDDEESLKKVIESEKARVRHRLRSHYANDVWEHRTSPPSDWSKELPESIRRGYDGSHLQKKADDLRSGKEKLGNFKGDHIFSNDATLDKETSSCSIV